MLENSFRDVCVLYNEMCYRDYKMGTCRSFVSSCSLFTSAGVDSLSVDCFCQWKDILP